MSVAALKRRQRVLTKGLDVTPVLERMEDRMLMSAVTETAEFWVAADPIGPTFTNAPISAIELVGSSGGGGLFTNTYSDAGGGAVVINSIGANKIAGYTLGTGQVVSASGEKAVYVIYSLSGTSAPTAEGADATYTSGRAIFIEFNEALATFNPKDPSTWQFESSGSNVLGVYDLLPQQVVTTGPNGDDVGVLPDNIISAGNTNFTSINLLESSLSQGILLFDFVGNGDAHPNNATQAFHVTQNPQGQPGTEGWSLSPARATLARWRISFMATVVLRPWIPVKIGSTAFLTR